MRIVDRKTFLALPAGTMFQKVDEHLNFDNLQIKGETTHQMDDLQAGDFIAIDLCNSVDANSSDDLFEKLEKANSTGESIGMDFGGTYRDGLFDENQKFAVLEKTDHTSLIRTLTQACIAAYNTIV